MKVSRFLKDKKVEAAVADLRPKVLIAFILAMVAVVLFWVFRFACVTKIGFWYTVWNCLYIFSRFVAVILLFALVVLWIYMLGWSVWDKFGKGGSGRKFVFQAKGGIPSNKKAEPGDYNWQIDAGDLSEFD